MGGGERNDSQTGHYFDTDRFIDTAIWLSDEDMKEIYKNQAHKVYSRLKTRKRRHFSSLMAHVQAKTRR